jgi:anti-sigma B factor antagonist
VEDRQPDEGEDPPVGVEIDVAQLDGQVTITVAGELDAATLAPLADELAAVLAHEPERVVIEASRLSFIDASGVRLLTNTSIMLRRHGIELAIAYPQRGLRRLIDLLRVDEHLPAVDEPT